MLPRQTFREPCCIQCSGCSYSHQQDDLMIMSKISNGQERVSRFSHLLFGSYDRLLVAYLGNLCAYGLLDHNDGKLLKRHAAQCILPYYDCSCRKSQHAIIHKEEKKRGRKNPRIIPLLTAVEAGAIVGWLVRAFTRKMSLNPTTYLLVRLFAVAKKNWGTYCLQAPSPWPVPFHSSEALSPPPGKSVWPCGSVAEAPQPITDICQQVQRWSRREEKFLLSRWYGMFENQNR